MIVVGNNIDDKGIKTLVKIDWEIEKLGLSFNCLANGTYKSLGITKFPLKELKTDENYSLSESYNQTIAGILHVSKLESSSVRAIKVTNSIYLTKAQGEVLWQKWEGF